MKAIILRQFMGRPAFELRFIDAGGGACQKNIWDSIGDIITHGRQYEEEFIIICEDERQPGTTVPADFLLQNLLQAYKEEGEIWIGSLSGRDYFIFISQVFYKSPEKHPGKADNVWEIFSGILQMKMVFTTGLALHRFPDNQSWFASRNESPVVFGSDYSRMGSRKMLP